jgi:imidazolonepropionase-like amidohydrolase
MLCRGFTTVRDAGGADWGLAQALEEGDVLGPRLLFTGAMGGRRAVQRAPGLGFAAVRL